MRQKIWKCCLSALLSGCVAISGLALIPAVAGQARETDTSGSQVTWVVSQEGNYWQEKENLTTTGWDENNHRSLYIDVDETVTYQEMAEDVWGGCFNERGWHKLMQVSEKDRNRVLDLLFDPREEDGLHLTMGRIPMGSSDYAMDMYSLDDVEDDYDLSEFSIARDLEKLIPFIKAALERQPDLKLWASPWSPPYWMKIGGTPEKKNGGLIEYTEENMAAYGQYFRKFIDAYADQDIHISMVSPQNEPTMNTGYSSCVWSGGQLRDFIRDYLGPALKGTGVEIYLGTFTNSDDSRVDPALSDPDTKKYISGITFQWWSYNKARSLYRTGFDMGMMQSETMCGDGWNNWQYAKNQFDLMWLYLESGISSYNLWNMVLEWDGVHAGGVNTTGGWFQNAPVTVNETTKEYTLNPQYYEVRHFSSFIMPGARRISSTGTYDEVFQPADGESDGVYTAQLHEVAFRNPDGTNVLQVKNGSDSEKDIDINFNGRKLSVTIPANSLNTFTTEGTPLTGNETDMRDTVPRENIVTIQNAATGQVLCVFGGGTDKLSDIIQFNYGDQANQQWILEPGKVGDTETVKLVNAKSFYIAAVNGGYLNENERIILWPYEGSADQNWILEKDEATGYYKFKNAKSGLYLTMENTDVAAKAVQKSSGSSDLQLWKIKTVTEKPDSSMLAQMDRLLEQAMDLGAAHTKEHPVYTQATYEALIQAARHAEEVAEDTDINEGRNDKNEVVKVTAALQTAVDGLVKAVTSEELAALASAISDAQKLDSSQYTPETYLRVKNALDTALLADRTDREAVLAAVDGIRAAIAGLQVKPPVQGADKKPDVPPIPKKNEVYKKGILYYTVTKSAAKGGTVKVTRPGKKTYKSITIPKTVTIGAYTFKVTAIEKKAFYKNTKLARITIGENVTFIGGKAFAADKKLKKIVIKAPKIRSIEKYAFKGIAKKAVINVPSKKSVLKKYKNLLKKSRIGSFVKVK